MWNCRFRVVAIARMAALLYPAKDYHKICSTVIAEKKLSARSIRALFALIVPVVRSIQSGEKTPFNTVERPSQSNLSHISPTRFIRQVFAWGGIMSQYQGLRILFL